MQNLIYLGFFAELSILYLVSVHFIRTFATFLYQLTKSHRLMVYILAFLFLPGTIIHEFAHSLTARLLLVRVGKIELKPQLHEGGIKLGSAEIGLTDPIRRMIIGFAPVFWGIALLLILIQQMRLFPYLVLLITYFVFAISNTMFSSKKDLEGTLEALGIILLISLALYFTGAYHLFIFAARFINFDQLLQTLKSMELFLLVPIILDLILWGLFRVLI